MFACAEICLHGFQPWTVQVEHFTPCSCGTEHMEEFASIRATINNPQASSVRYRSSTMRQVLTHDSGLVDPDRRSSTVVSPLAD
jgi:hypothetical protein